MGQDSTPDQDRASAKPRIDPLRALSLLWPVLLGLVLLAGLAPPLLLPAETQPDRLEPLVLAAGTEQAPLAGHFSRLVDPARTLTALDDALKADADGRFEPRADFRGVGQTRDLHWYRFDLRRTADAPADWILEMGEAYIDHLDLFVPDDAADGGHRLIRMGDFVPFSERPMRTRLHAVALTLPADRTVPLYLRADSVSALSLSARLWTPAAYIGHQTRDLLFQGLFFGALGVLMLGYLALGLLLRDGVLLAFTANAATVFAYYLFANGVAAALLPDLPGWAFNLAVGSTGFLGFAAAVTMWSRVLELPRWMPRLHRLFRAMALLALLAVPSALSPVYAVTNPAMTLAALAVVLVTLACSFRLMRRRPADASAHFYFASTLVSVGGLLLSQLTLRGGLPAGLAIADPYQIATLLSTLVLGAGLALRIRRLESERARAREESAFATKRAEEQRTLVAMLSHEFRTPLAVIDGAAQMIELTGADDPATARARLQRIRATTRKMADLVDLFLSSDALDQGALALRPEPVTLGALLDEALDGLVGAGTPTRVGVEVAAPDRRLRADAPFLGVAIGNLVQNALRYSPPETPVRVSADAEPGAVVIRVADRGHGMTDEEVERIGSIYFRAASSRGTKGAGIGLYMTQKIVAAHGGTLEVASVRDHGSVFTIRIPDGGVPAGE